MESISLIICVSNYISILPKIGNQISGNLRLIRPNACPTFVNFQLH